MNAIAAIAVRTVGAGGVAALLSLGFAGGLAHAASSSSQPATSANAAEPDPGSDRRAVRRAVFEAEADVLGIKPATLRDDLRRGQKISDLARDKGMTKEQFADKLAASLRPSNIRPLDERTVTG